MKASTSKSSQERLQQYLRAAAVLWQFDPAELLPDGPAPASTSEPFALLRPHVVRLRTSEGDRWTLRDALRPALLRDLDGRALRRLRRRNRAIQGPQQQIVNRWLRGRDARLRRYELAELAVLERMMTWFEPPLPHLPPPQELEEIRGTIRFRQSLWVLAGVGFHGRRTALRRLLRFARRPWRRASPAAMVIHGIGGVGKSTLAARLLLNRARSGDEGFALAYLDFDQPTLDIADGVTLLLEILRQAVEQRHDDDALELLLSRARATTTELASRWGSGAGRSLATRIAAQELALELGANLHDQGIERVVLVLDTFEEVQYAQADHRHQLQEQLDLLDATLPGLRTIIVSRARLELPGARYLVLGDLDHDAARALLRSRGVQDEETAEAILAVAGGNPLSLELSAALVQRSGRSDLGSLTGLDLALRQELIQGQLYQRFLQHVHDCDVQRLAHPGLVVRRLTPEIIREVLAEPCGLGPIDPAQARDLFARFGREVSLVRWARDGALEHRPELRRVMLRLLAEDRPETARTIHQRAADHYRDQQGDAAAAEEAYHRFALGELGGPWLERLTPDAAKRLRGALPELPRACWTVLASYAGIDLPEELWASAQLADRERRLAARLEDLLDKDLVEKAAALLEVYPPSGPDSVLWRWQGRAFALLGRLPEALEALERAATTLQGSDEQAREDLRLAQKIASKLGDTAALERLQARWEAGQPPARSRRRGSRSARPAPQTTDEDRWLDEGDLRLLVSAALAEPGPDGEPEVEPARPSTQASATYAKLVTLNQRRESVDASELRALIDAIRRRATGDSASKLEAIRSRVPPQQEDKS
jgi:cellulose synthase operon protein C